jgi:hypothetical protein
MMNSLRPRIAGCRAIAKTSGRRMLVRHFGVVFSNLNVGYKLVFLGNKLGKQDTPCSYVTPLLRKQYYIRSADQQIGSVVSELIVEIDQLPE